MRDTWQIPRQTRDYYCESGISDGQFCFIRAMTTSLRSIGTTPPRNIRTLLALQVDYVRWQIFEIIH